MEQCKLCNFKSDSKVKLSKHILHTHKLKKGEYLIKIHYNGVQPTCSCGCGTLMKYNATLGDFPKYIKKHLHIIQKGKTQEEIFGDMNSSKRIKAISEARKKRFKSGEYNHVKKAIQEARKDPDLGKKISKGAKGIPKPKPEGFGIGRKHSEKTKQKMSKSAIKNILQNPKKLHTSKLEEKFKVILELLDIEYQHFFFAPSIKKIYDFYIPKYKILIEVDGDFWHCNPKIYPTPVCKTQIGALKNDKLKNKWAEENGYKLLRFWEYDINNNIKQVKQILLENLK
jgi:very-short-patch-repair endonuclease